jgi:hypothetical protein
MVDQHGCILNCAFPEQVQVEYRSEFISKTMDKWAYIILVTLDFSYLGKAIPSY